MEEFNIFAEELVIPITIENKDTKKKHQISFAFNQPPDDTQFELLVLIDNVSEMEIKAQKIQEGLARGESPLQEIDAKTIKIMLKLRKKTKEIMVEYFKSGTGYIENMAVEEYFRKMKPAIRNELIMRFMQVLSEGATGEGKKFQVLESLVDGMTPN